MDDYWFLFSELNQWMEELDRRHSSKVAGKSSTPCKVKVYVKSRLVQEDVRVLLFIFSFVFSGTMKLTR